MAGGACVFFFVAMSISFDIHDHGLPATDRASSVVDHVHHCFMILL